LKKLAKRKQRAGEVVCVCKAYKFPHRFSGGRCTGKFLVRQTWEENFGNGVCGNCNCVNNTEFVPYCEVLLGQEEVTECQTWIDFVQQNEVKIYGKRK